MASNIVRLLFTGLLFVQITRAAFVCPTLFDFYPDPDDCTKFYRCFWGAAYPFHCPTGTKWNHKLLTCDFEYNVDCDASSDMVLEHSQTQPEEAVPTEIVYDHGGDHEYGKHDDSSWETENYADYDHGPDQHDNHGVEGEAGGQNSPIHGLAPGLADPRQESATPQVPAETLPSSTTPKSLMDYLYPDRAPDGDTPKRADDTERSDVTHDYAWYEGRDYNPDYLYDDRRKASRDYGDYLYDYWRNSQWADYNVGSTETEPRATTVPTDPEDYSYEVSYFQNGYPGYRHHYEPTDFLSPAYARHNGPIGKRK